MERWKLHNGIVFVRILLTEKSGSSLNLFMTRRWHKANNFFSAAFLTNWSADSQVNGSNQEGFASNLKTFWRFAVASRKIISMTLLSPQRDMHAVSGWNCWSMGGKRYKVRRAQTLLEKKHETQPKKMQTRENCLISFITAVRHREIASDALCIWQLIHITHDGVSPEFLVCTSSRFFVGLIIIIMLHTQMWCTFFSSPLLF